MCVVLPSSTYTYVVHTHTLCPNGGESAGDRKKKNRLAIFLAFMLSVKTPINGERQFYANPARLKSSVRVEVKKKEKEVREKKK